MALILHSYTPEPFSSRAWSISDKLSYLPTEPCHHHPTLPPETPGHSRARLGQSLVGSLLPSPGSWCAQGSVCALPESVSPVLCKFWQLCGGVNGDLLQEVLCHTQVSCTQPKSAAPRAPAPVTGHCLSVPLQETLKHISGSWHTQGMFEPSECFW